jgi:PAS domain S-box-containing protein
MSSKSPRHKPARRSRHHAHHAPTATAAIAPPDQGETASLGTHEALAVTEPVEHAGRIECLVVQNDVLLAGILLLEMIKAGYSARVCATGEEALRLYEGQPLIVIDVPDTGEAPVALAKEFRLRAGDRSLYILGLAVTSQVSTMPVRLGFNDMLVKPLDREKVGIRLTAIASWIQRQRHTGEILDPRSVLWVDSALLENTLTAPPSTRTEVIHAFSAALAAPDLGEPIRTGTRSHEPLPALSSLLDSWQEPVPPPVATPASPVDHALHQRRAAVFNLITEPVLLADRHGLIIDWNHAAEGAFGHTRQEMLGRDVATLFGQIESTGFMALAHRKAAAEGGQWITTLPCEHRGGNFGQVDLTMTPLDPGQPLTSEWMCLCRPRIEGGFGSVLDLSRDARPAASPGGLFRGFFGKKGRHLENTSA